MTAEQPSNEDNLSIANTFASLFAKTHVKNVKGKTAVKLAKAAKHKKAADCNQPAETRAKDAKGHTKAKEDKQSTKTKKDKKDNKDKKADKTDKKDKKAKKDKTDVQDKTDDIKGVADVSVQTLESRLKLPATRQLTLMEARARGSRASSSSTKPNVLSALQRPSELPTATVQQESELSTATVQQTDIDHSAMDKDLTATPLCVAKEDELPATQLQKAVSESMVCEHLAAQKDDCDVMSVELLDPDKDIIDALDIELLGPQNNDCAAMDNDLQVTQANGCESMEWLPAAENRDPGESMELPPAAEQKDPVNGEPDSTKHELLELSPEELGIFRGARVSLTNLVNLDDPDDEEEVPPGQASSDAEEAEEPGAIATSTEIVLMTVFTKNKAHKTLNCSCANDLFWKQIIKHVSC